MRYKWGTRFLAFFMTAAITVGMLPSAAFAAETPESAAADNPLMNYLTEQYGDEAGAALAQNLEQKGLLDENGNLRTYQIEFNGSSLSLEQARELLADPDFDLTQTCEVDGQEITMEDLKTLLGIEDELSRIQDTYFSTDVQVTEEHQEALASLVEQLNESGITLSVQPSEEQDNAALDAGYKSQLARVAVTTQVVTVNQGESATFTFTLSKALPYTVSFDYRTLDGAATAGKHYESVSGTVTFQPGQTTQSVTVQTKTVSAHVGEDVSADVYASDRWEGARPFFVQCYNPRNVLFDGDRRSLNLQVNINGNYDYDIFFGNGSIEWISSRYNVTPNSDTDTSVRNAPGLRGGMYFTDKSQGSMSFRFDFVQNNQDLREYVREGLIDTFTSNARLLGDDINNMYLTLFLPGITSGYDDSKLVKITNEQVDWGGNGQNVILEYDIAANRQQFLNQTSMSFGAQYKNGTMLNWFWFQGYFYQKAPCTVKSVTAPAGTYYPGDVVPITVTFSEPVRGDSGTKISIAGLDGDLVSTAGDTTYSYQHTFLYTVPERPSASINISSIQATRFYADLWWGTDTQKKYSDTTSRPLEGVQLTDQVVENTFTGITLDSQTYAPTQKTASITVGVDTNYSKWLEQEGAADRVKASIDGGNTLIDLTLSGDGSALTGTAELPAVLDGTDRNMRVELYYTDTAGADASQYTCVMGTYTDFVVEPVVFAKSEDMSILYPDEWVSGKEDVVYLAADRSTKLSYSYSGDATYPVFRWSSNNEEVAGITEDGTILPRAAGQVTFRLTATNGDLDPAQNVYLETRTITVSPGGDPVLTIPEDLSKIYVVQGSDAQLFWSTNIIYKNQNDIDPPVDTDFTVRLYEGNLDDDALATAQPLKVYQNSEEYPLRNVTSFSIPKEDVTEISGDDVPSYTVTVQTKHPLNDSLLTAKAYIVVSSPAAVVQMEKPSNIYLLDSQATIPVQWTLSYFDSKNEGEFEFSVTRNDTLIENSLITYDPDNGFTFGMTAAGDSGTYNGQYDIPVTQVSEGTLYDIYTVNVKAKNKKDSTWSYDSMLFYVYNSDALDILVNGQKGDEALLSNISNISGMSSEEILALNRDINLGNTISINYGDYAWAQVTDKIRWMSTDSSVASINYQQGGLYDRIENYSYTTYRPSEEFILSGLKDGQATIRAVHDKTGMETSVNVTVETLKDKLYLFQVSPKTETELTYTNGNGEQKTVYTNADGALALYEESGIASDIHLKSTYEGSTYLGTIFANTLASGEEDASKMGLYPVNNLRLREPAQVTFYLQQPDGTPYTGELTYRGGVYKNGAYCAAAEISGEGETVTLGADGKLQIQMDVTKFWSEDPQEELRADDSLEFDFEVVFPDNSYRPVLLSQNSRLNQDNLIRTAAANVQLTKADKAEPFIAAQTYRTDSLAATPRNILGYTGKVGPSATQTDTVIDTTILWWGKDPDTLEEASVELQDEFGTVPTGQSYQTFRYPFSTITVTKHSQKLNESTIWMQSKYSRGIQYQLKQDAATVVQTLPVSFRVINMLGTASVLDPNSGTTSILVQLKDMMTVDGGSLSFGDALIGAGLDTLEAVSFSTSLFTMQIAATEDPTRFNVLIQAGKGNMDDELYFDTSEDTQSSLTPGLMDVRSMLKGEYLNEQKEELAAVASKQKGGDRDIYYNVSGYYEGEVVYNYETDRWETIIHGGGFNVGGGMGYHWLFNSWVGPIPVTAELGLGAAVAVDFNAKALYEERSYNGVVQAWQDSVNSDYVTDYLSTLRVYAYLNAFGGLGFDYSVIALKIGVFGEIALDNQNSWLNREYLENASEQVLSGQSLTVNGQVGIRFYAAFLFISYETVLASASYTKTWVYNNWEKIQDYWEKTTGGSIEDDDDIMQAAMLYMVANPQLVPVSNTATLESRDYLAEGERSWNSNTELATLSLDDVNGAPVALQTNAYPHANPKLTEDGQMFVYLSDSGSTDVAQTTASYAIYNGAGYEDKGAINVGNTLGGYGDSNLSVAGNSTFAAAVWVQQKNQLDKDAGDTLTAAEQALLVNAAEVVVSLYENGTWTSQRLTDNATPDLAPVVATNGNDVFVAWRSVVITDENNVTDFSGSEQILAVRYNRATKEWSEPVTVYNGTSGSVMGLQAAMLEDGTAAIVYTLDRTPAEETSNTENYEIVYSVLDSNQQVVKNQQLTSDEVLDENPQITTAVLQDKEQFVMGWYRQEQNPDTQTMQSDIRMASVDGAGTITTADVGMADSLAQATGGRNLSVDANFHFVQAASASVDSLSLVWTALDDSQTADSTAAQTGLLRAVRFAEENGRIHTSAVVDLAQMEDGTVIDAFSAYSSGENQIKALILGSYYTGETDSGITVPDPETNEETPVLVPTSTSGMYTATATYQDDFAVDGVDVDLGNMMRGFPLPVQFTVTNNGIHNITSVKLTVGEESRLFDSDSILIQPNQSVQLTLDYPVPDDVVVDPAYKVEVTFSNGQVMTAEDTLRLTIPDVGISTTDIIQEEDGNRTFAVTLYNESETPLAGSGQTVKLGFYTDSGYTESLPGLDVITLSTDEQLALVDAGAYTAQLTFNLKQYLSDKGYDEVPDSGIPVYCKAWIEKNDQQISEYDLVNNTAMLQFTALGKDLESNSPLRSTVQLSNDTVTTATVELQNLNMQETSSWNAVVSLLDENGTVLESRYLAETAEDLLNFGPEQRIIRSVTFTTVGNSVEVVPFVATADEMNADLASLKASGVSFNFSGDVLTYEAQAENLTQTTVTAVAAGSQATLALYDTSGTLLAEGTGSVSASVPLQYTRVNDTPNGNTNCVKVVVTPADQAAAPKTYVLNIENQQKTAGTVSVTLPATNDAGWTTQWDKPIYINANIPDAQQVEYSFDGQTWTECAYTGSSVEVPLPTEDGIYTLHVRVKDSSGGYITSPAATLRIDRTAPVFDGGIQLEETNLPLEQENGTVSLLGLFETTSRNQMKLTVSVSDAQSDLEQLTLSTEDGRSYPLTDNGDGTYFCMITHAYDGDLTVTAVDHAGNAASVNSGRVLIEDTYPVATLNHHITSVLQDQAVLNLSATYTDAKYFDSLTVRYKSKDATDWTEAAKITNAAQAKDRDLTLAKLKPATEYQYQLELQNVYGDAPTVVSGTFTTACKTPAAPVLASKDSYSITLQEVDGAVYRCRPDADANGWTAWTANPVFDGLNPGTTYVFEVKIQASGTIPESAASSAGFSTYPLYSVTFQSNTAEEVTGMPQVQQVGYNQTAAEPAQPDRPGYTFLGWYTDADCKQKYSFDTPVTKDQTLYAGWAENMIQPEDYVIQGTRVGDWYQTEVVIRPVGHYTEIWNGTAWAESMTIRDGKAQQVTFKLRRTENGKTEETTFLHEPLVLNVDTQAPTGTLMVGKNSFRTLLNRISFGLLFSDTVTATLESSDAVSGVASNACLVANGPLTLEELMTSTDWKAGNRVNLDPDQAYVVYGRVIDQAGHVVYLSTDGVIVDATAPEVHAEYAADGVWTTSPDAQISVEVTENLSKLDHVEYTVNGTVFNTQESVFRIANLPDGDYSVTITAWDEAGNSSDPVVIHVCKETTAPALTVQQDEAASTSQQAVLQLLPGGEYASGMTLFVSKDGAEEVQLPTGQLTYNAEENGTYTFRMRTGAGQEATAEITVDSIGEETQTVQDTEHPMPGTLAIGAGVAVGILLLAALVWVLRKRKHMM